MPQAIDQKRADAAECRRTIRAWARRVRWNEETVRAVCDRLEGAPCELSKLSADELDVLIAAARLGQLHSLAAEANYLASLAAIRE